jgi:hypothetical protein
MECHDSESKKGGVDLASLEWNLERRGSFDSWV